MRKQRMTNEFDHDWNDVSIFEKLPVRKTAGKPKRDDWKRNRKVQVRTKRIMQEQNYG